MLPFRKVLFPVDYSEPCEAVLPYVKEMVRRFSADLSLVHAYGPGDIAHSNIPITDPDLEDKAQIQEKRRLRDFARGAFPGQHVEVFAELGEAGSVVGKIIQHQSSDLVMMATHGHGPIRRFLLGSVAAKVLHDISAAVWTGTGSALMDHAPQIPYTSVLCALDESDETEGVLRAGAALAWAYQAQLSILHVVEIPLASRGIDFTPYEKETISIADSRLRDLKGKLGIDAPHVVIKGVVADGVREEALRQKTDLIVTGRGSAQATFSRILSHVYPIVRAAPCPVLSI